MAVSRETTDTYPEQTAGAPADPPVEAPPDLVEAWREFEAGELELLEEEGQLYGAGTWTLAPALAQLLEEANAANPRRDKRSDGTVGDARHAARSSRHNPDARGYVNALDLDVDGLDVVGAFERARQLVLAGKLPQLEGGCLIVAARQTSRDFRSWLEYEGDNPHVTHGHVELGPDRRRQDDARPWGLWSPDRPSTPRRRPTTPRSAPPGPTQDLRGRGLSLRGEEGASGPRVAALQSWLRRTFPLYAGELEVDREWGPQTSGVLREFGRRAGVPSADGRNVGPQLSARLWRHGFRG